MCPDLGQAKHFSLRNGCPDLGQVTPLLRSILSRFRTSLAFYLSRIRTAKQNFMVVQSVSILPKMHKYLAFADWHCSALAQ